MNQTNPKDLAQACRLFAWQYSGNKGIRCSICEKEVWGTKKSNASEEYEALGIHLQKDHPELHKEIIERWLRST